MQSIRKSFHQDTFTVWVVVCLFVSTSFYGCLDDEEGEDSTGGFVDDGQGGFVDDGGGERDAGENTPDGGDEACGDGTLDPTAGESCDGANLNGEDCDSLGLGEGDLGCTDQCTFEVSGCTQPDARSVCGDGTVSEDEVCEPGGVELRCADLDEFDAGDLACSTDCTLDTSLCTRCGDGAVEGDEECDGSELSGASCETLTPDTPVGTVRCDSDCRVDTSDCEIVRDTDGDEVLDPDDPAPEDFRICGDSDNDGCDDCSLLGRAAPQQDGYDSDQDGQCELPLDYDCMNGAHADDDPNRLDACIMMTHVNQDRAEYNDESNDAAPLRWSEDVWEVAMGHSMDMCRRGFFDHVNPDGDGPSDRAAAAGLGTAYAENIAVNFDAGASQYAFMNEPTCIGHRGNVLDPKMFEIGIGYHICDRSTDVYRWGQHHHVTQNFRMDFNIAASPFCERPATHCEVPPNPPTTATCPQQLIEWGFCPRPTTALLGQWGCPDD